MSDQQVNFARPKATAPILFTAAGVGAGLLFAPVKRGYRNVADLLTMEADKFQRVADKAAALEDGNAVKGLFAKIKEGREAVAAAGEGAAAKVTELLGEGGALKDIAKKDIKSILPKAKGWWATGLAIVGIIVGRMISVAKANKKNAALVQAQMAQQNQNV